MYPAQYADGYNNVIAVSSTNADDQMSSFSNYNSSSTKIFAPGGYGEPFGTNDIYSTTPNYSFDIGGQYGTSITYGYMAGTSQATPLVAGVAALILAINNLSPLQVRTIISNTGDLIYDNTLNGNISRLNAYEALKYTLENYGGTIGGSGRTVTFHEDITIESGKTLTIATGTTVKFEPNDGLTVEGTLIADGVTFTSTSTSKWDGIFMDGASSSSVIKNCTITKAKTGIWLDDTDMTVEKNEIYNTSDYGIYIYGCSPKITDNYIHDTDDYGIAVNGSSTPYIRENSIKECEGGVFGFGAQSLKMIGYYGNYYGKNEIEDYEDEGVLITGGTPDLGLWGGASYKYGYNNIIKGSGSVVKNTTSSEVSAEKNYWGGTPQSYWFSGDFSWIKYLTSPYVYAGSSLEKIMDIEPDKLMLLDASELTDSKSYQLSSDKFKQLISEYPDSKYAGIALAWSMIAHNKAKDLGSQRGYLDEQIYHRNEKVRNSALLWLQILEAYVGNKEAAEKVVNSTSIKDAIGVEIRLNFANDLLNKFNDNHMAETIFSEIVKYDDSPPILRTIEAIKKTARNSKSDTFVKEGIEKEMDDILLVNENSLLDAYPNPFNPSTTINYKLQQKSNVSLIIYNSIGQEVAVLVNQQKEQGIHSVDFNASNLPSGLYIYRLQVHGQNGKNNYVQAKKMILMK